MSDEEREAPADDAPMKTEDGSDGPRARIFQPGDLCKGGRYKVFELLGAGGMGEVWEVFDEQAPDYERQWAAVKVLRSRLAFDDESLSRLQKEARALMRIKHPNLVRVYQADVDEEKNVFFYVMERLRGETLDAKIHRAGALPLAEALRVTAEIADGAHMLHEMGIIHRDLKPDNVFVTDDGRVVVLDLGVAKFDPSRFPDRATLPTGPNMIVGTFAYMSPEQCLGEKLDARSDVYALGLILYICLTGFHAAQGSRGGYKPQGYKDWAGWHLHNHPKPLPQVLPWLPKEVWSVVKGALAKERGDRIASAERLSGELRGLLELLRRHELLDLGPPVAKRAATGVEALANATTEELLDRAASSKAKAKAKSKGEAPAREAPRSEKEAPRGEKEAPRGEKEALRSVTKPLPVQRELLSDVPSRGAPSSGAPSRGVPSSGAPSGVPPRSEPPLPSVVTAGGTEIVRALPVSSLLPSPRTANGTEVMRVPSSRDGAASVRPPASRGERPPSTGKPVTVDSEKRRRRDEEEEASSSRRIAVAPPASGARVRAEQTRWLVVVGAAGIVCGLGIAAITLALSSGRGAADVEPRGVAPVVSAGATSTSSTSSASSSEVAPVRVPVGGSALPEPSIAGPSASAAPSTSAGASTPAGPSTPSKPTAPIAPTASSGAKPGAVKGAAPKATSTRPNAPFSIEPKSKSDRILD